MRFGITKPICLLLGIFVCGSPVAFSQDIILTGGGADVTWFFDSTNNSWDVVFRQKGDTVATGLTNEYGGPAGGVGAGNDWNFETLRTVITNPLVRTLNGNTYFTLGTNEDIAPGRPDLGIRTRLRELDNDGSTVPQFGTPDNAVGFQLNLDWDASTRPDGAEFAFWREDLGVRYETAASDFNSEWPGWGHSHWIWGFSHLGEYNLVFNFQGVGGTHGPSSQGTVNLAFSVVPEPSSLFILAGTGLAFLGRRRRKSLI